MHLKLGQSRDPVDFQRSGEGEGGSIYYCADGVNVGACAPRSHTSIVSIVGFARSVSSSAAAGARGALLVTVARGPLPQPTRGVARKSSSNFSQP